MLLSKDTNNQFHVTFSLYIPLLLHLADALPPESSHHSYFLASVIVLSHASNFATLGHPCSFFKIFNCIHSRILPSISFLSPHPDQDVLHVLISAVLISIACDGITVIYVISFGRPDLHPESLAVTYPLFHGDRSYKVP